MNIANKITLFRVILIPVFLVIYMLDILSEPVRSYVAVSIFIIASLTDMLDGYIARSRNLVTNFGKFADPLADKLLVCAAMVAMVEKGLLPSVVVILILSREFIVTGFRLVAAEKGIVIAASFWGKIKTVFQMLMIIYIMIGFKGYIFEFIGNILIWAATVLTVISAWDYIWKNKKALID